MKSVLIFIMFSLVLFQSLFAIDCNSMSSVKSFNGHYYAKTSYRTNYETIRISAENDKGYLAIPNSAEENTFIKSIIGGNAEAWIGVYDPNHAKNYCYDNATCFSDDTRFRDVKNKILAYKNWASFEPNNFVESTDITDNLATVDPLGENWVIMNGNTGQWYDVGNHKSSNQNPRNHVAIIEFEEKPICYTESDAVTDTDFPEKVCNTQVFDNNIANADKGITTKCLFDINGKEYCPQGLADAASYWSYIAGESIKNVTSVTDYAQGEYKEYSSTVRDYANSNSTRNIGTVIDYDTGKYIEHYGSVVDYASPNSTIELKATSGTCQRSTGGLIPESPAGQWYSYVPAWAGSAGAGWDVTITKVGPTTYKFYYRLRGDYKWSAWRTGYAEEGSVYQDYWKYGRDYGGFKVDLKTAVFYGLHPKTLEAIAIGDLQNMPVCKSCGSFLPATELTQTSLSNLGGTGWLLSTYQGGSTVYIELSSDKSKYYYSIRAGNGAAKTGTGVLSGTVTNSSYYNDGKWDYSINFELTSSYVRIGQWGSYSAVYSFNNLVCYGQSGYVCPNDYVQENGVCKKTINFKYYSYGCEIGYVPQNKGLDSFSKTDPDMTISNWSTLDDDVNSATPPAGNCSKVINYNYYTYGCETGYTAINTGLSSCNKTDSSNTGANSSLANDCNNATPPAGNCYKDIKYNYYTYGCPAGYSISNYGLTSCPKTDPNNTINNENELNDNCNNPTPPVGNCSKSIDYAYYQYVCTGSTNSFNQPYTAVNSGLSSCPKTDTDKVNINSGLADSCNSPTPPVNNCRTTEYTCNSQVREPVWLNNKWQCSPYPCYGNNNVEDLSKNVGSLDKENNGWTADGKCTGTIYIFSGGAKQCRSSDKFFGLVGGGCCEDDKYAMGLMSCNAEEKELQIKKEAKKCHYVGEYCSKKVNIGVAKMCVRTSKSYCCFNSTLGRIIAEQGRNQLTDIDWGVASNPNCRGFTVEEFQRLDLSQMDLSEFTNSIQLPNVENKQTAIIDKINSHINLIK